MFPPAVELVFRRPAAARFQPLAEDFRRPVQAARQQAARQQAVDFPQRVAGFLRALDFRLVVVTLPVQRLARPERTYLRYWLLQTQTPEPACGRLTSW